MNNVNPGYGGVERRPNYRIRQCMRAVLFIALFCPVAPSCTAQLTNVTDVTSTPIPGAGHDYIGLLSETVNPANGAVSLRIQVPIPPGRGVTMPFSFTYDSNGVHYIASGAGGYGTWNYTATEAYLSSGGWSYSIPQLTYNLGNANVGTVSCPHRTAYVFQDNAGTRYAFPMAISLAGGKGCTATTGAVYRTTGQYAANFVANDYFAVDDPDGAVYTFDNAGGAGCGQSGSSAYTALPYSIEDRNGNLITISGPPTNCNGSFTVTDTAGRPVLSSSGFGASGNTLTVSGLTSPYQLEWGTASSAFSVDAVPTYSESQICGGIAPESGTEAVVTSLTLPNGQSYKFYYDSVYGLLEKVVYPNNGYVSYTWAVNALAQDVQFPGSSAVGQTGATPTGTCEYHIDSYAVQQRTVSYDGIKVALQQTFKYATNWIAGSSAPSEWSTKTTTVTSTDSIAGTTNTTSYTYSGYMQGTAPYISTSAAPEVPLEQSIAYIDGSGATLQTVTKTWQDPYAMTGKVITLPNKSSSSIAYKYGPRDQVIEEDETDYGQSNPTRKTLYNYQTFAPVPQFPNVIKAPTFSSIVDRPCQILREDASGNVDAEQDLLYDGGTAVCGSAGTPSVSSVSGLPTGSHDPTNYGVSSTTARGNLTSYTQKCLQNCQNATTTYTYDMTGQATSKTDPCGNATCSDLSASSHKTTFFYTDSPSGGNSYGNSNAYVTTITDPLGHSSEYSYNYPIGVLAGSTDANHETTTYNYGTEPSQCTQPDMLNRLTEVVYPDGGITEYCYNDSVPSVETARLISGSTWETNIATMDSMNHVTETELLDPSGPDMVLMSYDGEGRLYTKTNPYRTTTDPTYGVTTYQYDAISRPASVQNPDKSFRYWCYDGIVSAGQNNCRSHIASITGDWVDFADEKGNNWQKTADSFGRLTNVIEPNGAATYYSYDILDNLVCAAQDGGAGGAFSSCAAAPAAWRPRSFTYDSLSRLIQSFNPETGWVCYGTSGGAAPNGSNCTGGYDANGNLASRTDARDITTNYSYDALNRLLSKRFSKDPGTTPSSCYQYDSSSLGVGRLASEWTQSGSAGGCAATAPSTGLWTRRSILSYDAMGRVLSEQQCTPSNCVNSTPYSPAYTFDQAGNQYTATNGVTSTPTVGTLSFTSPFDGAGRLLSISSNWNDATHPSSLFSAQSTSAQSCPGSVSKPYAAFGGLTNASYGGNLTLNRGYDVRLRTTCEADTGSLLNSSTNASATVTVTGTEQSQ